MTRATQLRLLGRYCRALGLLHADLPGRAAFRRFERAPPRNITPKQAAFLAQARRTDVPFEGETVAAYEWGPAEAPYVYTAYGWGYNAGRWRHFAPQLLDAGYRVCAFDYLGHGNSTGPGLIYPTLVRLHRAMLARWGRPARMLCHSFGSGTAISALTEAGPSMWPERYALLAPFSDLEYIFRQYARALGFGESHYASLDRHVRERTGQPIAYFDVSALATRLGDLPALIAHDPEDAVTAYSNAERLHAHWPGSLLLPADGAGHGFSDAGHTRAVIDWLVDGTVPATASPYSPELPRLPSREAHDGYRSTYFTQAAEELR